MGFESIIVWLVLGIVILLFASDRIPPDAAALAGLLVFAITGVLTPAQMLAGFSSPAVITIASLLILSAALERAGAVRWFADKLHELTGDSVRYLQLAGTVIPGLLSGIVNIVATVSVFIPVLLRASLMAGQSPSRLLLPMACVAMAGANLSLIGASHNLVVNDILQQRTDLEFSLLEITPIGIVMIVAATVYVMITARWLLPERVSEVEDKSGKQTRDLIKRYAFDEQVWEFRIQQDAAVIGTEIGELDFAGRYGLSLISLVHRNQRRPRPENDTTLEEGDILLLGGRRGMVDKLDAEIDGLDLQGAPAQRDDFSAGSAELIEVLVPPRSDVIGKSIRDLELRDEADLTAIALWRDGKPVRTYVETTKLRAGDAILLYGNKRYTRGFDPEPDFRWFHPPQKQSAPARLQRMTLWIVLIFVLVIAVAALGWLPIVVTTLAGALAVALIGALRADKVYAEIDWRTVVMIAAMLPFATAMNSSGASAQIARWLTTTGEPDALVVMGAIALVTLLLTQALHNAAAAAVMTPVALDSAQLLGVNPKSFAVAVLVAASMSVLMPTGHPAVQLVRGKGDYSAGDYLRFGSGLVVLTLVVILVVVPWLWPFTAKSG